MKMMDLLWMTLRTKRSKMKKREQTVMMSDKRRKRGRKSPFSILMFFLPLLVIEVDEFVCFRKTECLIIDK